MVCFHQVWWEFRAQSGALSTERRRNHSTIGHFAVKIIWCDCNLALWLCRLESQGSRNRLKFVTNLGGFNVHDLLFAIWPCLYCNSHVRIWSFFIFQFMRRKKLHLVWHFDAFNWIKSTRSFLTPQVWLDGSGLTF